MDLVASKVRRNQQMKQKTRQNKQKNPHRAFPSLLLALNGFILPAAKLCFMEIFLPFSLNDNYYNSFFFTGKSMAWPWGKPHALLARSCITSEVVLSFAGKQMLIIFLLKKFNSFESFGGSSLVALGETGLWKEKGGWREEKVTARGDYSYLMVKMG